MNKVDSTQWFSVKRIWQIALPIIIGSLAQDIITVVDTAFIGRLGEIPLGAAAIGGMFYLAIVMLGWGFGLGIQILISRRLGENKLHEINSIFMHALYLLLLLAGLTFLLVRLFAFQGLLSVLQSESIALESIRFLNIRVFGIFAAFVNLNFRAFYIGTHHTRIISFTTLLMAIVNIALDYVLIFGKLNFPTMGIEGAALASVISEYTAMVVFVFFTLADKKNRKFQLFQLVYPSWNKIKRIFTIALPTMLQNFISFATWFVFFLFVERMGEFPLAVSNIIRSIYIVMLVPIFGFASATNTLVSYAMGRGEIKQIKTIVMRSVLLAVFGIAVLVLFAGLMPEKIIGIYTKDASLIAGSVPVLYTIMMASFAIAFGFVLFQAVSGTGKTQIALYIEITVLAFYLFGVYTISGNPNAKINTVWLVEVIYGLGLGLLSIVYLKWGRWRTENII